MCGKIIGALNYAYTTTKSTRKWNPSTASALIYLWDVQLLDVLIVWAVLMHRSVCNLNILPITCTVHLRPSSNIMLSSCLVNLNSRPGWNATPQKSQSSLHSRSNLDAYRIQDTKYFDFFFIPLSGVICRSILRLATRGNPRSCLATQRVYPACRVGLSVCPSVRNETVRAEEVWGELSATWSRSCISGSSLDGRNRWTNILCETG